VGILNMMGSFLLAKRQRAGELAGDGPTVETGIADGKWRASGIPGNRALAPPSERFFPAENEGGRSEVDEIRFVPYEARVRDVQPGVDQPPNQRPLVRVTEPRDAGVWVRLAAAERLHGRRRCIGVDRVQLLVNPVTHS